MSSPSRLQRLVPHLQQHFASLTKTDGLFPILTEQQAEHAWSCTPGKQKNEAAILVPLIQRQDEIHLVFTKRTSHMRSHSAEIAFPGGGREQDDLTLVDTALRETREELVHPDDFQWTTIGSCAPVPSIRGVPVTSVLAVHTAPLLGSLENVFPGCPNEVERVFSVSLEALLEVETTKPFGRLGTPAPVFIVEGEEIWGLTAFILQPLLHKVLVPVFLDGAANKIK